MPSDLIWATVRYPLSVTVCANAVPEASNTANKINRIRFKIVSGGKDRLTKIQKNDYLCGEIGPEVRSSVTGTTIKTAKMKKKFSAIFLMMAVLFTVCLIASNLFASKIVSFWGVNLPGAVIVFPISYILNDCIAEVWGYRKARLVIWIAFLMNFIVVLLGQVVAWLPGADFWDGAEHFDYMFTLAPRVAFASLLAFVVGSNLNAWVMSKMKVADKRKRFWLRAVLSSLAGEFADSLIFMPLAFMGTPVSTLGAMMLAQVSFKVCYEIVALPLTSFVVRRVKQVEEVDVYDRNISYNPFKISDI